MSWSSWSEFLAMGGYGLYVWGAFGVTAAVMLGEVLALRAKHRTLMRENLDNAEFEGNSNET
ncbi:MAG: heme exporter protein CcmD [Rhizobacter sp.]|nr:heme exporter protein CcmD [Rhizobacter sp.]